MLAYLITDISNVIVRYQAESYDKSYAFQSDASGRLV